MLRSHLLLLALASSALLACGDDSMVGDDTDDTTTGVPVDCDMCPAQMLEADEIPYDNAASMLMSTTVQGALDELADPRPLVELVEDSFTFSGAGDQTTFTVDCPGDAANRALALGGACPSAVTNPDLTLLGTSLQESSYSCTYGRVPDVEVTLVAQVRCQSAPTVE